MRYILIIVFLLSYFCIYGQENHDKIIISSFKISGNYKTKDDVILRELDIQIGDTLDMNVLSQALGRNQTLLLNTGLFYTVKMNIGEWDALNHVTIPIEVEEAWYLFPVPIFDLADRNFSVWRKEYNYSLKRVNYGMKIYHSNLTGRRDRLKAVFQLGYTRKYELQYELPYINQQKTIGLYTNFLFAQNKEVNYNTIDSKQQFYRNDDVIGLKRYRFESRVVYRPKLYTRHTVHLKYNHNIISDTISIVNPNYFKHQSTQQRYFSLGYRYTIDKRDLKVYPKKGWYLNATIEQNGLGIFKERNNTQISTKIARYVPLDAQNKFSLEFISKAKIRLQNKQQAFFNNRGLGYFEDYLRGYEYYVIDGTSYVYVKNSLRYALIDKVINWKKAMPFQAFKKMPLRMYLTGNTDIGYVHEKYYKSQNPLSNKFLVGGGLGLDVVFYVDKVIRFEYSMNHKKESDLYIHFKLFF